MIEPKVFISYSHKDEREKDELLQYLSGVLTSRLIEAWNDQPIKAGANWEQQIEESIDSASVAILIITPSFLSSHFIQHDEVHRILQRRENEGLDVFALIAQPCDWQSIPWLREMNIRPTIGNAMWSEYQAGALAKLADEVGDVLKKEIEVPHFDPRRSNERYSETQSGSETESLRKYFVPSFFRDDSERALKERADWLEVNLGFDGAFLSKLLNIEEQHLREWRGGRDSLPEEKLNDLREFWEVILHLLSFSNMSIDQVNEILRYEEKEERPRLPFDPPWLGTSIVGYLEKNGRSAVQRLSRWIQSFQFADRYSNSEELPCP